MGDLLEDIKEDSSDFLAKSSKKGLSGRKKGDLGMGPFREFPAAPKKDPVELRSEDQKKVEVPVAIRSLSGLNEGPFEPKKKQTGLKTGLPEATPLTDSAEVVNKVSPKTLRRNPKKVLRYLFDLASSSGERTTPNFNIIDASETLDMRYESLRTALKILRGHKLIERVSYRPGPNGWCQFRIFKDTYKELNEIYTRVNEEDVESDNSGLRSGSSNVCSSSNNLNITTTTGDDVIDQLSHINLSAWNISRRSLVKYVGPGNTCETVRDMEEFLHRAKAAIEGMKGRGEVVRSPAGFLMHCLKEGYVGVPEGYKSLEEIRIEESNREKRERLERMRAAKEEQYRVDFALFKEEFDPEEKRRLLEGIREEERKRHPSFASKATLDKTIQAKFEEVMKSKFEEQYSRE